MYVMPEGCGTLLKTILYVAAIQIYFTSAILCHRCINTLLHNIHQKTYGKAIVGSSPTSEQ